MPEYVNVEDKTDMQNIHKGYCEELKKTFSDALGKDRLYHLPCGYVDDQQIWMVGVLLKYAIKSVLHMGHKDFITAMRCDLSPLLGNTGLWLALRYEQAQKEKGNKEK